MTQISGRPNQGPAPWLHRGKCELWELTRRHREMASVETRKPLFRIELDHNSNNKGGKNKSLRRCGHYWCLHHNHLCQSNGRLGFILAENRNGLYEEMQPSRVSLFRFCDAHSADKASEECWSENRLRCTRVASRTSSREIILFDEWCTWNSTAVVIS